MSECVCVCVCVCVCERERENNIMMGKGYDWRTTIPIH